MTYTYEITPADEEINDVLDKAEDRGLGSCWPDRSYDQGVRSALLWVIGKRGENPMDDG